MDGEVRRQTALAQSVTASTPLEASINRQMNDILIQQARLAAMGELISGIGYQWRQPLNCLSLLIQDVKEAFDFGELNEHYIDRFTKESLVQINQISQTIHDLRRFYRPDKLKTFFSITDAIEMALSIFSPLLKTHDIVVDFEYRGNLLTFGYANEFSQAVLNILTNARDAFVEKNVKIRKLQISISEKDETLIAEFTDNGGGIEPNVLENVFDPYFTTRLRGSGLGLYMTKMILENMGGYVKLENTGSGTRVSLCVPKVT